MTRDRRSYLRKPVDIGVEIKTAAGARVDVTVVDVSPKGLCLSCPAEVGKLEGEVSISAGTALAGKASVRFQGFNGDGTSLVGLELLPGSDGDKPIGPDRCWSLRLPGAANDYAFKYYDRLRRLDTYIQDHFEEKISLNDAAEVVALERSYFCRYFHEKVGLSFTQYMQRVRLGNCIDILLEGDSSITEACYQSGFGDLRHFERTFRKWTDLSPTDFRSLAVP